MTTKLLLKKQGVNVDWIQIAPTKAFFQQGDEIPYTIKAENP
jgi:hypothetical protein